MKLEFKGFNERLEELIEYSGKTHKELASETGISKNVIDSYTSKNGSSNPSAENAIRLAKSLGTTAEFLMTGQNPLTVTIGSIEERSIIDNINMLSSRDKKLVKTIIQDFVRA